MSESGRSSVSPDRWSAVSYTHLLGAAGLALILTLTLGPIAFQAVEGLFWFFTYHLNLTPFLFIIPLFALSLIHI